MDRNAWIVIGACGLVSPTPLQLTWWPLFRDSLFYAVSLLALALALSGGWDEDGKSVRGQVHWWEAGFFRFICCIAVI